jgi:hypothetical protein
LSLHFNLLQGHSNKAELKGVLKSEALGLTKVLSRNHLSSDFGLEVIKTRREDQAWWCAEVEGSRSH